MYIYYAYIKNRFPIRGGHKLRRNTHAAASGALAARSHETLPDETEETLAPERRIILGPFAIWRSETLRRRPHQFPSVYVCVCVNIICIYTAYIIVKTATSSSFVIYFVFPLGVFFFLIL